MTNEELDDLQMACDAAWVEVKRVREIYDSITNKWASLDSQLKKEQLRRQMRAEIEAENAAKPCTCDNQ